MNRGRESIKIMAVLALALLGFLLSGCEREGDREFAFEETVVVPGCETTASFAVKELNDIVKKSTGGEFDVSQDASSKKRRIFVGRSAAAEKILGAAVFDDLKEEESAVFAKGNDLFLIGGDPLGVLWAVYDFCEDSLGYRWYLNRPDGEKIVKTDLVRYNGVPTRRRPAFRGYRSGSWNPSAWHYYLRNRSNSAIRYFCTNYVYKFTGRVPGHGFNFFIPVKKRTYLHDWAVPKTVRLTENAFRDHPEWFSLMPDGKRNPDHQLCLSNPGCRKEVTRVVIEWMKASGPGIYQVGVNDARFGALCHCDTCKALSKKYNTNGGPLWDFILELCAAVSKAYPQGGYYIHSLAYDGMDQTEKAPDNIVFPENFIVDIAYIHICDRSIKELPDKRAPEGEMVNFWKNTLKWCSITKHQSYWFYGTASPLHVYRRMQKEIRELHEAGVESVYSCGAGGGYEFGDMTSRFYLKLLFDPYCDIRKEVEDAVAFKYGPAAPEMLAFIDSFEQAGLKHIASSKSQVLDTGRKYHGMMFLKGRDIADWQQLFAAAEKKVKGMKFYEDNVRFSKLAVDVFTVLLQKRIRAEAPEFKFDVKAVEAEGREIAMEYGKRFLDKKKKNEALGLFEAAEKEMAYYGNLKDESLPKELLAYQAEFVTRILPIKNDPYVCGGLVKGKFFSEPDPKSACGYRVVDDMDNKDLSKGIPYYIWDAAGGRQRMNGRIPLSVFKKGEYVLYKLGETEIPSVAGIIFAEKWASPLAHNYLGRCFNPAYPKRRYEVYASLKAEGPKFFPGETGKSRLSIEQFFVCEILGSGY